MTRAYIGLGSNRSDPHAQLDAALAAMNALPSTSVGAVSPRYWTEPVGDPAQPEFLNAVAAVETGLEPLALLGGLQRIENDQGRSREPDRRWGPRTIDLDLLLFGTETIDVAELTVPHPRMTERAFVLRPLADVSPGLEVPGAGPVATLLARVDTAGVRPAERRAGT
ncbi:MAG: 2-amino-4-hydroxy-6-hydroxymethyldihydropteridine diphosphokinase [Candidatus Wenzhouxiangella sp. M2_3B_020]